MEPGLSLAVLLASGGLAAWAAVTAALGRAPGRRLLQGMLGLQLLLLGQLGLAAVRLGQGARPAETGAFYGYALMSLLLLPGAFALTTDERTRYGTLVLAAACVTLAVVEVRMDATWR